MWLTVKIICWFAGKHSNNVLVWNWTNLKGFLLCSLIPSPTLPKGSRLSSISNLLLQTFIESSIDFYYEWTVLGIENSLWNVSFCINLMDDISDYASWKRILHVWLTFMRESRNTFCDILLLNKSKSEWSGLSGINSWLCLKWVEKKKRSKFGMDEGSSIWILVLGPFAVEKMRVVSGLRSFCF